MNLEDLLMNGFQLIFQIGYMGKILPIREIKHGVPQGSV